MKRASIHIVVRSICCAKIKGVDLDTEKDDVVPPEDPELSDSQHSLESS
jgi:hypothetical protein